jgi:amino acid adenylation domain-containing protein
MHLPTSNAALGLQDLSSLARTEERAAFRRIYPCTSAQHRFWALNQMEPGNAALNVAVRWQVDGAITQDALERCWAALCARHEPLRSFVAEVAGDLQQIVEPHIALSIPCIDLSRLPPPDAVQEAERIASEEARRPFNLSLAPLLRVTRLRLSNTRSILLVTAHHIICDGWSVGLLADEMCALLTGQDDRPLAADAIQFGEYAGWQTEAADPTRLEQGIEYWRQALRGLRQFELLPDYERPRLQSSSGHIVSLLLDRPLTNRLAALAADANCSLFAAALAALMVLLYRHNPQPDIALGTQLAGRDAVELEQVVGVFINTVVLRADLGGNPPFRDLLAQVAARVLQALEHADTPFEKVVAALKPPRDPSRNPLFSINFIFQRAFVRTAEYDGLTLTDLPSTSAGAMYDLNFFMVERPDGWRFSCEYNTDLFHPQTVTALLGRYAVLLASVTEAPETPLSALPIMDRAERELLLADAARTAAPPPPFPDVVSLVRAQRAARPDATAVSFGPASLTYRDLAAVVDRVAAALRAAGIGAGDRVGVLLERRPDLPAALLGVMASGAAYVPLDPSYPLARLAQIVEDADLAALLTSAPTNARLTLPAATRIMMDDLPAAPITPPNAALSSNSLAPNSLAPNSLAPNSLAYVIYTSGSTGQPKGVQVGHAALANLLWSMRTRPGLAENDVLLGVTTISFDIAMLELFLPLVAGAQLVLASDAEAADGQSLRRLLRRHRVTVMQATPVTWRLLLDAGWRPDTALRMLCGGEALPRSLADALTEDGATLWNMYGPTETTIWSAACPVQPGRGPVPIGGPIANTQLYVLDPSGQLVPPGVQGELHIGGAGVSQGYFRQPALTAERFVPDPFSAAPALMYRTGDMVRRHTDGTIDFLGRLDYQVKLRGFRIELGAIEASLLQCPGVADAVVVAGRSGPAAELELWAYIASAPSAEPAALEAAARRHLTSQLPLYMVPQRIISLPALPRTPNGKVDRAALPAPAVSANAVTLPPNSRASSDDVEARLAEIWCRVLDIDAAEPSFDFFELGGNSLTATRMLAEVNAAFERTLRPPILFRHPTLGELADLLRRPSDWDFDFSEVVQLQPEGTRPTLIALNNTGVFFRLARRLGRNQPFIALQLFDPSLGRQTVSDTFEAIAEEYVRLILQAQPQGPYALIGWCVAGSLAFEVAHQMRRAGREVCLVVIIDAWAPGFSRRQTRRTLWFTDLSLKFQTIFRDLVRVLRRRLPLEEFIQRRGALRRWLGRADRAVTEDERYHHWILGHLNGAAYRYDPPDYDGDVLLLRAAEEPRGLFIESRLGWGRHVTGRLTTAYVQGDHTTIFTDPGAQQMADQIAAAMDRAIS